MLELADAVFGYVVADGSREITAPITFSLTGNTITALAGPSGVGKSTILKSLAGLIPPLRGDVEFDPTLRPGRVTWFAPQTPISLPFRNVLQNALAARELDRALTPEDVEVASDVVGDLGLANVMAADPRQLSGGMRRRLTLVQGLLSERPLLLLDEPLAELDLNSRQLAERTFVARGPGPDRSVIFASHDIDSIVAIADRVLVLQAPLPAHASLLSLEDRFPDCRRDPVGRRASPSFASTVTWVQQYLWDQWDAYEVS